MSDELQELKKKRQCLETDIETLSTAAGEFLNRQIKSRKLELIAKSNGLHKAAKLKREEVTLGVKLISLNLNQLSATITVDIFPW